MDSQTLLLDPFPSITGEKHVPVTTSLAKAARVLACALCLCGSAGSVRADGPELIVNGGFETGDFTGWTVTQSGNYSDIGVDGVGPHNGLYSAYFGSLEPYDTISQTIATGYLTTYNLSFYLDSSRSSTYRSVFYVDFGGYVFFFLTNGDPDFPFQQFNFELTAYSTSTVLTFGAYNEADYYTLDDISLTVPEPRASWLFGAGLAALLVRRGARRAP